MIGVAVVGCGYWGPNVIRNLAAMPDWDLRWICDKDVDRLSAIGRRYPAAQTTAKIRDVLADPMVEAVAICTPVHTHHALAKAALEAGKHVLVEKPLAQSVEEAGDLVEMADRLGLTLMVDHVFVYSGAVRKIREIVRNEGVGDLLYVDSVRINLGLFQSDVNVVWDLAPHDISIIQHVVGRTPRQVSAIGSAHFGAQENLAYVTVRYDDGLLAHMHVNWLAPVKIRSTVFGGSKKMIVYDDLDPSEKVRVYDKGVDLGADPQSRAEALVDYRVGDMHAPYIEKTEPLERMCRTFHDSIAEGSRPETDGAAGLDVVRVLAAAQQSMRQGGAFVDA